MMCDICASKNGNDACKFRVSGLAYLLTDLLYKQTPDL